jgi:hypothetical protein
MLFGRDLIINIRLASYCKRGNDMLKNYRLIHAIEYLERSLLSVPDDMTTQEIIDWADQAESNDNMAKEAGYDDIENWAEETGHACFNTSYTEDVNPHFANR